MAHDDETHETSQATTEETTRRGRHLAETADGSPTTEAPDGEYTSTDGVSHTDPDEEGSYVDTSAHEEDTSVKGSYVDSDAAGADTDVEGEYTDRDE